MFCLKIKSKIGVVNELLHIESTKAAHFDGEWQFSNEHRH